MWYATKRETFEPGLGAGYEAYTTAYPETVETRRLVPAVIYQRPTRGTPTATEPVVRECGEIQDDLMKLASEVIVTKNPAKARAAAIAFEAEAKRFERLRAEGYLHCDEQIEKLANFIGIFVDIMETGPRDVQVRAREEPPTWTPSLPERVPVGTAETVTSALERKDPKTAAVAAVLVDAEIRETGDQAVVSKLKEMREELSAVIRDRIEALKTAKKKAEEESRGIQTAVKRYEEIQRERDRESIEKGWVPVRPLEKLDPDLQKDLDQFKRWLVAKLKLIKTAGKELKTLETVESRKPIRLGIDAFR